MMSGYGYPPDSEVDLPFCDATYWPSSSEQNQATNEQYTKYVVFYPIVPDLYLGK